MSLLDGTVPERIHHVLISGHRLPKAGAGSGTRAGVDQAVCAAFHHKAVGGPRRDLPDMCMATLRRDTRRLLVRSRGSLWGRAWSRWLLLLRLPNNAHRCTE